MARNKTPGDAMRRGAVKSRSQIKNPITGAWIKREDGAAKIMDVQPHKPMRRPKVNRFEVIDYTGDDHLKRRAFVKYGVSVELSYQDEGRTLKVFVTPRETERKEVGE